MPDFVNRFNVAEVTWQDRVDPRTGFLHARALMTQAGVLDYGNNDGTVTRELKHPDDIKASMESMKRLVLTHGHPTKNGRSVLVDRTNVSELSVGHGGDALEWDDDKQGVWVGLTVTKKAAIDDVLGGATGVSQGYQISRPTRAPPGSRWNGKEYDLRQGLQIYNHLAVAVPESREGPDVAIRFNRADNHPPRPGQHQERVIMENVSIQLGGATVTLPAISAPLVQTHMKGLEDRVNAAETQVKDLTADRDKVKGELDQAVKDKGDLEKRLNEAPSVGDELKGAVKFLGKASQLVKLNEADVEKLIAMPAADRVKDVVLRAVPAEADAIRENSAGYFAGRFDALVGSAASEGQPSPAFAQLSKLVAGGGGEQRNNAGGGRFADAQARIDKALGGN